jgi:Protein of unknown function (DUF3015)
VKSIFSKKKIILLSGAGLSLLASNAYAVVGSAGCGLGSLIFKEEIWWKQVLAATTNGSSANQTFGITSGTSNCAPGVSAKFQRQKDYIAANLSSLQREVPQGSGDTVKGFASVLGCPTSSYPDFGVYTQSNYNAIFNSNDPSAIVINVKSQLQKNVNLSKTCDIGSI